MLEVPYEKTPHWTPAAVLEEDHLKVSKPSPNKAMYVSINLTLKLDYQTYPPLTCWKPI